MSVYTIVVGSTRKGSQSAKVAGHVAEQLRALSESDEGAVEVIDLAQVELPPWHEGFWDADAVPCETWARVSATLSRSDALVFVTPEWNGMVPPSLMNVFLLSSRGELAHKPALIVAVSAGSGGAYPVLELRAFGGKNTQVCYIPDHVIVRDARNMLNGPEPQSEADAHVRERIRYGLDVLRVYSVAFRFIRRSGVIDLEGHPYGM